MGQDGVRAVPNRERAMERFWHLESGDFFHGLEPERRAFLDLARRRALGKLENVFSEGQTARSCFYLEQGLVRIYTVSGEGKESMLFLRRQGEIFGLAEVLESLPRKANAQAILPAVIHELDQEALESFLARHPRAAKRAIGILGRRLRYLGDLVEGLVASDPAARLAKLLVSLGLGGLSEEDPDLPVALPVRLTQERMASMIGSCQQTVCQALKLLQDQGLIRVEGKSIAIQDFPGLVRKAGL